MYICLKIKLIICLLLVSHVLFSQDIQNYKINNSTPPNHTLTSELQLLLLNKNNIYDTKDAIKLLNYIIDSIEYINQIGLTDEEQVLVCYYQQKYDAIIDICESNNNLYANKWNRSLLFSKWQEETANNYELLADDIDATNFSDEKKGFLQLSLQYLLLDKDEQFTTRKDLNTLIDNFLNNYPNSKYNSFIKKGIQEKPKVSYSGVNTSKKPDTYTSSNWDKEKYERTSNWGWGGDMHFGYGMFTGGLGYFYPNPIIIGLGFDMSYKQLWLNANFSCRSSNLDTPEGNAVIGGLINLNTGHVIYDGNYIKLIPFCLIGYANVAMTNPQLEAAEYGSFAYGAGFNIDLKTSPLEYNPQGKVTRYLGFRLRYSFNFENIRNYGGIKGGCHSITLGINFFTHPSVY